MMPPNKLARAKVMADLRIKCRKKSFFASFSFIFSNVLKTQINVCKTKNHKSLRVPLAEKIISTKSPSDKDKQVKP